jgi:hypothetical protein
LFGTYVGVVDDRGGVRPGASPVAGAAEALGVFAFSVSVSVFVSVFVDPLAVAVCAVVGQPSTRSVAGVTPQSRVLVVGVRSAPAGAIRCAEARPAAATAAVARSCIRRISKCLRGGSCPTNMF